MLNRTGKCSIFAEADRLPILARGRSIKNSGSCKYKSSTFFNTADYDIFAKVLAYVENVKTLNLHCLVRDTF
jgi:hypothetical protein